ncbi:aminoglycoside phosphotransferase family protein [Streptomyces sp. H39-S7]|uniref:aminoglycoside phosphotransferase family protein n=1 Tax=Streptomyces sp. H39-S7 TaxID=3004357 RepID=UPI0022AFA0D4|nr:aminoglycoside phosphotransferase family protein [Streptomyces sp. H39-S7]MCZ4122527.1 phosphotransferase [Streptomyces sp. H39-S7]
MASAPRPGGPGTIPLDPPDRLVRSIGAWEGDAGQEWLAGLPGRVAATLERWELRPERVFTPGGRLSMIVLVRTSDDAPAVLKVGMVTAGTEHEHTALAHWDGRGAVRLLRSEPAEGAMLLERLQGEVSLRSLPEPKAMLEATATLQRLWVAPAEGHPFASVADDTAGLAARLRERRELPWAAEVRPLIDEALALREQLLSTAVEDVLLHGDYHHGNVLAAERSPWLAIDPKPLVGDRAYDLAWLVRDRVETLAAAPGPQAAARRRVAKLGAALDVDPERLRGWSCFRAVEAGVRSLSAGDRQTGELLLEFAGWL